MSEPVSEEATARPARSVPIGVLVIGMSIVVWWPAFTLGAWEELFFDQLLTIWVAATAALVVVLFERRRLHVRIFRALVLALPSVWLVLSFVVNVQAEDDLAAAIVDLVAIVAVLLGMPFTLWVLAHIMWPDLGDHLSRRMKTLAAFIVIALAVGSFLLGVNNAAFMTCEDFAISGNSLPPGCVHVDGGSGS